MSFFAPYKNGYIAYIKLTPNAAANGFKGVFVGADGQEYLKACVVAVPEKGKANKELIKMLSRCLKISKQEFLIVSGQTDHYKKIYIKTEYNDEFSLLLQNLQEG